MESKERIEIEPVIDLLDFVWNSLLVTRSVFNFGRFGREKQYRPTSFYTTRGCPDFEIQWKSFGQFSDKVERSKLHLSLNASAIIWIDDILTNAGIHQSSIKDKDCIKGARTLRNHFAHKYSASLKGESLVSEDINAVLGFVRSYDHAPGTERGVNIRINRFFDRWIQDIKRELLENEVFVQPEDNVRQQLRYLRTNLNRLRRNVALQNDKRVLLISQLLQELRNEN